MLALPMETKQPY